MLIIGNGTDPEDLDPHIITGLPEAHILWGLFEGLVNLDGKTLAPIPGAAERWEVSEDKKTYRFFLNENAKWSDGVPVSARDFEFSLARALTPSLGSKYAAMLFCIKNARDVFSGKQAPSALGVKALDEHTLEIELERPTAGFLAILANPIAFPVREDVLRAHGDPFTRGSRWTRAGNLVSNGPFSLAYWSVNDKVELRKNPHYWDADKVSLNAIRFLPISDQTTEERAWRAGQLHLTDSIPLNKIDRYRDEPCARFAPWLGSYYYIFNTQRPPLDDPKVRRALALAIDKDAIVRVVLKGAHIPARHFVPEGTADFFPPQTGLGHDPELARRLLAEAGYGADKKEFPSLSILYNTSDMHRPVAQAVQAMWKKELGIDVALLNVSWGAYLSMRGEGDFDIARASWVADINDPANFFENFRGGNPLNRTSWKSERFDELLQQAERTDDNARRTRAFAQAEEILDDETPLIPIFHYNRAYLVRPEVKNWDTNILDQRPLKFVRLEGAQE